MLETPPYVVVNLEFAKNIRKRRDLKPRPNLCFSQHLWEQPRGKKNNNPSWFNLQDWSVPVNTTMHAGRVRALLSVCLLHADTIRIAVCVPESHHLLSNTHTRESRTERCDWGRPGPSGHGALIAKLFFSSIFNRCNTPATEKGLHNRILQPISLLLLLCGSPSIFIL